jgi:hypothetical protein
VNPPNLPILPGTTLDFRALDECVAELEHRAALAIECGFPDILAVIQRDIEDEVLPPARRLVAFATDDTRDEMCKRQHRLEVLLARILELRSPN